MFVFSDIISGDTLFSDDYPIEDIDDFVYEVDCAMITVKSDFHTDIGSNPSAEEADECIEDNTETVNNVIYAFNLCPTQFDKKSYLVYIKGYMRALEAKLQKTNPERIPFFEAKAQAFFQEVISNFKEYEFFYGASMEIGGMVALLNYREDGVTPYLTFFKDGLMETYIESDLLIN